MATTITKTLGNGGSANGYDYGDFNAFASAVPANLVTADEQWILEVYATHGEISLSSAQAITGKTTDATRNIIIRAASGQSFNDHANKSTNALRYNASNGAAITNSSNAGWYVVHDFGSVCKMEGIQLRGTSSSPHTLINIAGDIDRCILECATSAYDTACIRAGRLINSVAYVVATTGYVTRLVRLPWDSGAVSRITSSTLYDMTGAFTAIVQPGGGAALKSTALFGFLDIYTNDGWVGSLTVDHSATNLATLAGTANLTSQTTSGQFESVGTLGTLDLRAKTGSGLISAGDRDQSYTGDLDVLEQTRSASTPTIGAFEYGAGGGGATITGNLGTATAAGFAASIVGAVTIACALGSAVANGHQATISTGSNVTITASIATATASGYSASVVSSGSATITTDVFKNNTGTVLASTSIPKAVAIKLSDLTVGASWTNQTTNGSGVLSLTGAMASGDYLLVVSNADGSAVGVKKYTAS